MKKVVELLAQLREDIKDLADDRCFVCDWSRQLDFIDQALALLKSPPRWETPEQWEERTGEPWTDDWAVYYRNPVDGKWYVMSFADAKDRIGGRVWILNLNVVCATEAGPPPDDWRSEG
jgi:hypothetical protein